MSLDPKKLDKVKDVLVSHIGEGVHSCLRKYTNSSHATDAYKAICLMPDEEWLDVVAVVAEFAAEAAVVAYGVPDLEARAARADELERIVAGFDAVNASMTKQLAQQVEEIAALKAELARFEWRRIEDDLPRECLDVCLLLERVTDTGTQYKEMSGRWWADDGYFIDWCDERVDFPPHTRISHWAYFPNPPQAKEADHEA